MESNPNWFNERFQGDTDEFPAFRKHSSDETVPFERLHPVGTNSSEFCNSNMAQIAPKPLTASSLPKSKSIQEFLGTCLEDKIVSKLQMNLLPGTPENCLGLGATNPGYQIAQESSNMKVHSSEERQHQGDALQLAMQEIDDESLLEPVSYEIKLAAMNAMIPKGCSTRSSYDCPVCSSIFTRLYDLKSHISRHFGLSLFLCSFCGRQFSNSSNLIRHVRIHSGDKPYKCKDCGKRFNQANGLTTHRAYVHPLNRSSKHCCPVCGRRYKALQLLKRHCKTAHQDENVKLSSHQSTGSKRRFHCPDCGESFHRKNRLQEHRSMQHGSAINSECLSVMAATVPEHQNGLPEKDTEEDVNSVLCNIQEEDSLEEGSRTAQPIDSNELVVDAKQIDNMDAVIDQVIDKVNRLVCLDCGKQFQRYLSYKQHWGVHNTSLRKYECRVCKLAFAWKSTYVKHISHSHSSSPPQLIPCTEPGCKKEYKSLTQLQEHVKRDHRLIRRFQCDECHKQFYKAHDLLVHKRTHSQEKPYMCGQCGKAFSHLSHVIRHEKSHNNIRPHQCQLCLKSFTQATVLRAHKCKSDSANSASSHTVEVRKKQEDNIAFEIEV